MADAKSSSTVTVACNIPSGLVLRVCKPQIVNLPVLGGGMREFTEYREVARVRVNGNAIPAIREPGKTYPVVTKNGFALTSGIDAEHWAAWLEANKDSHAVVNGCIFAVADADKADGEACRNHKDAKSGMEPLATDGDLRMPRRIARTDRAA